MQQLRKEVETGYYAVAEKQRRAHENGSNLVCRLLLEKKNQREEGKQRSKERRKERGRRVHTKKKKGEKFYLLLILNGSFDQIT